MTTKKGPNKKLIDLIIKRTKIKRSEVEDVLKHLPECLVQVFFEEEPEEKEVVLFSFLGMTWQRSKYKGSMIHIRKNLTLTNLITQYKRTNTTPLTTKLNTYSKETEEAKLTKGQ